MRLVKVGGVVVMELVIERMEEGGREIGMMRNGKKDGGGEERSGAMITKAVQ